MKRYVRGVIYFCRHRVVTWGLLVATVALVVVLMRTTKTGLVPDEDTGTVMVSVNTKPALRSSAPPKYWRSWKRKSNKCRR